MKLNVSFALPLHQIITFQMSFVYFRSINNLDTFGGWNYMNTTLLYEVRLDQFNNNNNNIWKYWYQKLNTKPYPNLHTFFHHIKWIYYTFGSNPCKSTRDQTLNRTLELGDIRFVKHLTKLMMTEEQEWDRYKDIMKWVSSRKAIGVLF